MAVLPVWEWFIHAVEGRPGGFSVELEDGTPVADLNEPIQFEAKPDPLLLAEFLLSSEPIPPVVSDWLANLLVEEGDGPLKLSPMGRGASKIQGDIAARVRVGELPQAIRVQLGKLLAEDKPGRPRLVLRHRRLGAPGAAAMANWDAAQFFEVLMEGQLHMVDGAWRRKHVSHVLTEKAGKAYALIEGEMTRQEALALTMQRFKLSRNSVENALRTLKAARNTNELERRADWEAEPS